MVCDPRSRAGERASDLALLTLASRSEPLPHSPNAPNPRLTLLTVDFALRTRSSLPATRVSWKHFTSSKTSHCHCGRKHGHCWTRQHALRSIEMHDARLVRVTGFNCRAAPLS